MTMALIARLVLSGCLGGCLNLVAAPPAIRVSEALKAWQEAIEKVGRSKVIVVPVITDRQRNEISLPPDTPQRAVLRRYFTDASFLAQFAQAQAMTINYAGPEGRFHFVLVNTVRSPEWEGYEEAFLAFEFGHAWLHTLGYTSPAYQGGADACAAVEAGNIVQSLLIRRDLADRRIAYGDFWIRNLEAALKQLESQAVQPERSIPYCQRVSQLALWLDVRLGLTSKEWKNFDRFDRLFRKRFPLLIPHLRDLEKKLRAWAPAPLELTASSADLLTLDLSGVKKNVEDYMDLVSYTRRKLAEVGATAL